jgi:hypothetical protein
MGKVTLEMVFSEYTNFALLSFTTPLLHTHVYLNITLVRKRGRGSLGTLKLRNFLSKIGQQKRENYFPPFFMCLKGINTIKQPPRIPTTVQIQVTGISF